MKARSAWTELPAIGAPCPACLATNASTASSAAARLVADARTRSVSPLLPCCSTHQAFMPAITASDW